MLWKKMLQQMHVRLRKPIFCYNYSRRLISSKISSRKLPKNIYNFFMLGSAFNIIESLGISNEDSAFLDNRLSEDMKNACDKSVEALVELMRTLNVCMSEINKEYVFTIEKQIELTKTCDSLGAGPHWDELTKYRVQAEDLKTEFNKYEILVEKIGQMVFYQAVTSLMSGNEKELDMLNLEYNKLEKVVRDLAAENQKVEKKLVAEHRNSILSTPTE